MRGVLPGNPVSATQAICIVLWSGRQFIAYIAGNTLVILTSPYNLLQAICDETEDQLEAIAFDETTGKIAVCAKNSIRVYRPYIQSEDDLKWSLQESFSLLDETKNIDFVKTLSWGSSEELLVGTTYLEIYSTLNTPTSIWKKKLANHVRFAYFSYDSTFIASTGYYDRFVKIWRRQSFESDDTRFDFSYLTHPAAVTNIHWRRPYHMNQTIINVLYTICTDQILRIWTASDPHSHSTKHLQLWNQIDLIESIKPRSLSEHSNNRFSFIIDSRDFTMATEKAVQTHKTDDKLDHHALTHLIEIANRSPEICVVLDDLGHMSAWGLENISCKTISKTNIFNIAHVDGLFCGLPSIFLGQSSQIRCYNYCNRSGLGLNILIHHFDGSIEVFESNVANLFDPSPRCDRLLSKAILTGHSSNIQCILRDSSGKYIVSRANLNETITWKHNVAQGGESLLRQSMIIQKEYVYSICLLKDGEFILFMHKDKISLWETKGLKGVCLANSSYSFDGRPCCLLVIPTMEETQVAHVAALSSNLKGIVWEVILPSKISIKNRQRVEIREFCHFDLGKAEDILDILPVTPCGSSSDIPQFSRNLSKDLAISFTKSGILRSWSARINPTINRVDWSETNYIDTAISEPALVVGSSSRKVAIVCKNRNELTIWNLLVAHVEHVQSYDSHQIIQGVNWASTPGDRLILMIQFQYRVITLAQTRFDYLNKSPSWVHVKEFSICDISPHSIGDLTWLNNGDYIIGAGNQMYIVDQKIEKSTTVLSDMEPSNIKANWNLIEFVTRINRPLPVYHPQFLIQCIFAGKIEFVKKVILKLYRTLTYCTEGDLIDSYLEMDLEIFYSQIAIQSPAVTNRRTKNFSILSENHENELVTESKASLINNKLSEFSLPRLFKHEQKILINIVQSFASFEKIRHSVDENATKFYFSFLIFRDQRNESILWWREVNWAYHSNSHDVLLDLVSHQSNGKILWQQARECGMFMWITDRVKLMNQFENIGKNEYSKTIMKNPIDCSLFYLALRKKSVLLGLWRLASWNREQAVTMRLLANNFQEKKWKTAAMKNAYALLGKHRFEYAAAFFLLADCLKDCLNVILTQLNDLQLAIAVVRVYDGDESPILMELLEDKVLPLASQEGNRWLASWAFWMIHKSDMSLRSPNHTPLKNFWAPNLNAKSYLVDDPALATFYSELHQKSPDTSSLINQKLEWKFVLNNALIYSRMGCDLLAANLIINWKFHLSDLKFHNNVENKLNSISRRNSQVVARSPVQQMPFDLKTGGCKTPLNMYEEPDSTSLLDSFGF